MECNNCKIEVKNDWNYCPRCGAGIEKWYDKITYGLDDMMRAIMNDIQHMILRSVLKVDIKPVMELDINKAIKQPQHHGDERYIRNVKEVVDVDANVVKGEFFTEVEMKLKDVKSLDDVYVVINDQSAEIRAYTHDDEKMYFKVVEVPEGAEIVDKVLKEDGTLIIRFEVPDMYEE